tara:strand:+ start:1410 stop:1877 length:468 start_codon:yes stop_codon:yes gene_type:complete
MVSKAHRGMMHVPRRGKGGGRTRPPRPPVRRMVTRVDPVTGRITGGVRRIEPRRPPRTHGDPMPTRRFPKEEQQVAQAVRNPKEIMQLPTNQQTTRSQLEKFMKENMANVANFNAAQARNRQITPRQRQASLEGRRRRRDIRNSISRNFRNRGPR